MRPKKCGPISPLVQILWGGGHAPPPPCTAPPLFLHPLGAGALINDSHNEIAEEAIHLGNNATVFQAEVFQWEEQHPTLYSLKSKTKFLS